MRSYDCNDQHLLYIDDITIVEGLNQSTGSGNFNYGETCVVTATPNTDYHFVNWTENGNAVSSEATYSFTVTGDRDLVANFSETLPTYYTISVTANPTNGGTVTGAGSYVEGSTTTLTATANEGYTFTQWQDGNTDNPRLMEQPSQNETYEAVFEAKSYRWLVESSNDDWGYVSSPKTLDRYPYNTEMIAIAVPKDGYKFIKWSDGYFASGGQSIGVLVSVLP